MKHEALKKWVAILAFFLAPVGAAIAGEPPMAPGSTNTDVQMNVGTDVLSVMYLQQNSPETKFVANPSLMVAPVTGPSTLMYDNHYGKFSPQRSQAYLFSYALKHGYSSRGSRRVTEDGQSGCSLVAATYNKAEIARLSAEGKNREGNSEITLNLSGESYGKIIAPIYAQGKPEDWAEAGWFTLGPDMVDYVSSVMRLGTRDDIEILTNTEECLYLEFLQASKTGGKSGGISLGTILRGISITANSGVGASDSDQITINGQQTNIVGYVVRKEAPNGNANLIRISDAFPSAPVVVLPVVSPDAGKAAAAQKAPGTKNKPNH
ncbi:MAG: hypothetical protein HGB18_05390 [Candidatus Moranbacteria bacterium]|nr:hypothetical protein [Candidatus Moranbacteria bacterium]